MEFVTVVVISGVLAAAFIGLCAPEINLYFYLPQRMRVQDACADLLDIIARGDDKAEGLRFAGPIVNTSATVTCGITAAFNGAGSDPRSSVTYTYRFTDLTTHTIVLKYFSATHTVTRSKDGGSDNVIPYYATSSSGILFDPLENSNFFRFYNGAGTELTGTSLTAAQIDSIYRVDVPVIASSGNALVRSSAGRAQMKMGIEIKHYGTPETPDI